LIVCTQSGPAFESQRQDCSGCCLWELSPVRTVGPSLVVDDEQVHREPEDSIRRRIDPAILKTLGQTIFAASKRSPALGCVFFRTGVV